MWGEGRAAGNSGRLLCVLLDGRGRGSIIWMALDGGFLRFVGRSCWVLRMISVPRGSGMSTPCDIWGGGKFLRVSGVLGESEVLNISNCSTWGSTRSSLAGGKRTKRGYTSPDVGIQQHSVTSNLIAHLVFPQTVPAGWSGQGLQFLK